MQEVIGDLMSTLWGHLKPQNNPFGPRVSYAVLRCAVLCGAVLCCAVLG